MAAIQCIYIFLYIYIRVNLHCKLNRNAVRPTVVFYFELLRAVSL